MDIYLDPRSVLIGEGLFRRPLAIRKALEEGIYYVESGELADALLRKAVLGGVVADAEENARNAGKQLPTAFLN